MYLTHIRFGFPQRILLIFCLWGGLQFESPLWGGTMGILDGVARDKASRQPLVGVNIQFVGTAYGTTTDETGYFKVNAIRAGVYSVKFSLVGYTAVVVEKVVIPPDLRTRLDIELEQTAIELEAVEVRYARPLIQKEYPVTAYSISEIKLEKLPVSAYQEILALQPGTTIEGNVRGGKSNEVKFLIDGLPVQDVIAGGLATDLPKSSIAGLTVYTGGFEAEHGNALSGVVNVITKSGGEHHDINIRVERDGWIPSTVNRQQDRSSQIEISAGGPLLNKEVTYFSANMFSMSDTRWWQDFQMFFSSPVQQEFSGFSKVEWAPSVTMKAGLQGIYSIRKWHDYEFSWRFNLDGLPRRSRDSYRVALIVSNAVSDRSSYSVSFSTFYQRARVGEGGGGTQQLQPYEYDFYLRYVIGGNRNWWADSRQLMYTLKGDFSTQLGSDHLLKAGIEFNQYDIFSDLVKFEPQKTYFGKPILGAPLLNYSNRYNYFPRSGSIFLQDNFDLARDGTSFTAGIRWDFLDPTAQRPVVEFIPVRPNEYDQRITGFTRSKFKQQLSPRFGVAVPVDPSTFFFVNLGRYFQFPLFDYLYSGINPAQLRQGTRNVLTGNPDLEPERTLAWEIGIRRTLDDHMLVSVTYFKKDFENQIDTKTLIPFDSKAAGDFGFASYVNNASANASGFEFVVSRERDERLSGSISYSYMVTEGVSGYADQTLNYAQWGFPLAPKPFPLSWDQKHTFKLDADALLWWGIQTNVIVLYNSPRPYSLYPTRDGFTPIDPSYTFIPNNARMSDVLLVNLKVSKRFDPELLAHSRLTVYADVRNLLNKKNVRWMDSNGRIGGELGDPSAYYDPRRVRIGLRYEF